MKGRRIDHETANKVALSRKRGREFVEPAALSQKQREELAGSQQKLRRKRASAAKAVALKATKLFKPLPGIEGHRQLSALKAIYSDLSPSDKKANHIGVRVMQMIEDVRRALSAEVTR
jgi:hypothetical protein